MRQLSTVKSELSGVSSTFSIVIPRALQVDLSHYGNLTAVRLVETQTQKPNTPKSHAGSHICYSVNKVTPHWLDILPLSRILIVQTIKSSRK